MVLQTDEKTEYTSTEETIMGTMINETNSKDTVKRSQFMETLSLKQ